MLRPSRQFGKRENVAALHREFFYPLLASAFAQRRLRRTREESGAREKKNYRPGRSSRLSSPAATLRPTWPCRLSGCNAIELAEPPTRTLPPAPTPIDALPCAPA